MHLVGAYLPLAGANAASMHKTSNPMRTLNASGALGWSQGSCTVHAIHSNPTSNGNSVQVPVRSLVVLVGSKPIFQLLRQPLSSSSARERKASEDVCVRSPYQVASFSSRKVQSNTSNGWCFWLDFCADLAPWKACHPCTVEEQKVGAVDQQSMSFVFEQFRS